MDLILSKFKTKDKNIKTNNTTLSTIKLSNISFNNNYCVRTFTESDCIKNILLKDHHFNTKYKIHDIIYEKVQKATYIIVDFNNNKYFLKIKHNSISNFYEKQIYNLLKTNKHKNVMEYIDYCEVDDYYYYIYEYIDGVNLSNYLLNNKMNEIMIKHIFDQMVCAVKHIHHLNIIHCDLKLDNIVITKTKDIKLIDFDLSVISVNDYMSDQVFGTLNYIAPESYDLCVYSKKSDVWSMGIILYVLITKKFPNNTDLVIINSHSNLSRRNCFKHLNFHKLKKIIKRNGYNYKFYTLLEKMLSFEDSKRITVDEIINYDLSLTPCIPAKKVEK